MNGLLTHAGAEKITRVQLAEILPPQGTDTHKPIAHFTLINALLETLAFRHINIVADEYAVTPDGMKLFGVLELESTFNGCRFALAVRNSNDKSMRLGLVVGFRVFCCDNLAFSGDFEPVLAKHSKHFDLQAALSVGIDQMQRNFTPMIEQVRGWQESQISDDFAKLVIYKAFVEEKLEAPKHLAREVHDQYFNPTLHDFAPRTKWSLQNSFTSAFKLLEPIPSFKATASFGKFFQF
jgi:Domain of unknown function (DUF932)